MLVRNSRSDHSIVFAFEYLWPPSLQTIQSIRDFERANMWVRVWCWLTRLKWVHLWSDKLGSALEFCLNHKHWELVVHFILFETGGICNVSFMLGTTFLNLEGRAFFFINLSCTPWVWNHPRFRFYSVIKGNFNATSLKFHNFCQGTCVLHNHRKLCIQKNA